MADELNYMKKQRNSKPYFIFFIFFKLDLRSSIRQHTLSDNFYFNLWFYLDFLVALNNTLDLQLRHKVCLSLLTNGIFSNNVIDSVVAPSSNSTSQILML